MANNNRIYLSPPETSPRDRELLLDAFDSNWIAPLGPHVDAFEEEFVARVGAPYAVAVSSGTAALHLSLLVSGVEPGSHVITPTLTFVATANAIRHAGAIPVFVDSLPSTWCIDPDLVEQAVTQLRASGKVVSAVMPVDIFGQCADYDALKDICERHDLRLIADAAESLGSIYRGKPSGAVADLSCFSFNGNKIISTSGGGMVTTHNKSLADRVRLLATQARQPGVEYKHTEVGYNYRLSNLLAALGRGQLADLDRRLERRRQVFETYQHELSDLPGVGFLREAEYARMNCWLTCLTLDPGSSPCTTDQLIEALEAANIESRPVWKPMHLQPAHADGVLHNGSAPVAERLWRQGLCLPSGSSLNERDQQRVIDTLRAAFGHGQRTIAA